MNFLSFIRKLRNKKIESILYILSNKKTMYLNNIFYTIKPLIPRQLQLFIRRWVILYKRKKYDHIWPIDTKAGNPPINWQGWPDNKKFALVISHDVDTQKGQDQCCQLMELEESLGFRSSFNFVPERYSVSSLLRQELINRGFEVGVHGLTHDGMLFSSKKIFNERALRINHYLQEWDSKCFTAPSMLHNLDWMHALEITHSTSTFDTDPFEPQPDATGTIFPFRIKNVPGTKGFIELPYTLPQDFTLFILMRHKNINVWKTKLDWIVEKGGMALFNSHPDYMNFTNKPNKLEEYPVKCYKEFLEYIKSNYEGKYWHALPKDVASFWTKEYVNNKLK